MKKLLITSVATLLVCGIAAGATDVSGKWAGAPFYFMFQQDGNALSGSGGPSEKEQLISFDHGMVDGDRITFKAGSIQFDLRVNGDEIRGEMKSREDITKVFLKRAGSPGDGGQNAAAFDVASVKRSPPSAGNFRSSMNLTPGRVTCSNVNLRKLIMAAYDVKDYQVSRPDWLTTEIHDITATMPAGTPMDRVLVMVQNLLAERFHLAFHRETKELPIYALIAGKTGPKLKQAEFGLGSTSASQGHLTAEKIPITKLADVSSGLLHSPVTDMTGLKGVFDFTLEWTPEARPDDAAAASDSVPGASIFPAVQEQLGLKLEARKGPVEILVIDRVEKIPTGN